MLGYIATFILGGVWGFIVCAFFVGSNSRRWGEDWGEEEYWRNYHEKNNVKQNNNIE